MTHLRQGRPERFTAGLDALAVAGWIRPGTFTELESILRAQGMDVHTLVTDSYRRTARLQILKVEIGGDINSTDGSESSIEHTQGSIDCNAASEWWLMEQARARNPGIKLFGLAWGAPAGSAAATSGPPTRSATWSAGICRTASPGARIAGTCPGRLPVVSGPLGAREGHGT